MRIYLKSIEMSGVGIKQEIQDNGTKRIHKNGIDRNTNAIDETKQRDQTEQTEPPRHLAICITTTPSVHMQLNTDKKGSAPNDLDNGWTFTSS